MLRFISFLQRLTPGPILDPPNQVLDRGRGYSNRFDSAEVVLFTHVYGIPLVSTGALANSHYGFWVENTPDPHTPEPPSDARNHPKHRSRKL
jgi:hypothetical protein